MTEDIVERAARAIEQRTIELQGEGKLVVHGYNDSVAFAQAALAAIRETHAIVPKEPREAMIEAGFRARESGMTMAESATATYTAMIAAAEGEG